MSFCPVIEIFPSNVDHFVTSDSRVILDVDSSTDVSLSQQIQKNDVLLTNEPLDDLTLSVPNTPKNFYYLKSLFDPATEKPTNHSITVRIAVGSQPLLYNKLFGVNKNKERIELRFVFIDNWIDLLKQTKLSDLNLGTIEFTRDHIIDINTNNKLYLDGDPGYWFPVVNYGSFRGKFNVLIVEDLRPLLHVTFLLQKMFEHIGWCIESPFYETDFGRSLIAYLWRSSWGDDEQLRYQRTFAAKKVVPVAQPAPGIITDWTEFFDFGNNFDHVTGQIENPFEGTLRITLYSDPIGTVGLDYFITLSVLQKHVIPSASYETIFFETFEFPPETYRVIEVPVNLNANEYIVINLTRPANISEDMPYDLNVSINVDVTRTIYSKGDIINITKELDDHSCWDLFHALQHLIFGIVDVDLITRTVKLLTPYNADIFGQSITGYFNNTLVDLIATQPIDTAVSILQNIDQLRYILLSFAKSTDDYLSRSKRTDGTEHFSKTIDLGSIYKRDTEEDRNPLFEGTLLRITSIFGRVGGTYAAYERMMPVMIDNTKSEISYDIKPRILYAAGFGYLNSSANEYGFDFLLGNNYPEVTNLFPFAFNHPSGTTFNGLPIDERLIYGNEINDLWSLVYGRFYTQYKGRIKIDFLSYLTHHKYFTLDLKNLFQIEYDGHPITGRLVAVNDFKPCKVISTQVTLLPEITTDNYCFDSEPEPDECNNQPSIVVMIDGTCYTFSIDGEFDCAIFSITWEKKIGIGDWEAAGTGSTLTLCDIAEVFIVRATIVYSCDCPNDIRTKTINPCNNNATCFIEQYTNANGEICLQFSYTGNFSSDYTVTVELNGVAIADPYLFCGATPNTDYEFIATFVFDNNCDDLILTCSTNTGDAICNNNPILICVPVTQNGVTCMTWTIGGSQTSEVVVFFVNWECSNGLTGVWMPGDDPVCCSGTLTAFAMVHYCDCPPVCTPTIQCDIGGCTVVSAGSAIQLIACN